MNLGKLRLGMRKAAGCAEAVHGSRPAPGTALQREVLEERWDGSSGRVSVMPHNFLMVSMGRSVHVSGSRVRKTSALDNCLHLK